TYDQISQHAVNALVATEDHRFYAHWGIDFIGIIAAATDVITSGDIRGASTISQQLARNLYNQEIGFAVTPSRKLKEALTAVQLERRYTKREIIEMYLNTVEFGYNAFGIEAASKTFFSKSAADLSPLEGATLVGMLKAITFYNPARNPENAQGRRNQVLYQMMKNGFISREFYDLHREDPVVTDVNRSSEITASFAPYFAEQVRHWMNDWAKENGYSLYSDGLRVFTPLDSELQKAAWEAVNKRMIELQAVVDYEWSRASSGLPSQDPAWYIGKTDEPFDYFWNSKPDLVTSFVKDTDRYRSLRKVGVSPDQAVLQLRGNDAFMDSLKTAKTRLEAGLVSIDPNTGYIKAWVGGRDLAVDWYDHVNTAARQPGSTFKPFIYTAAIDNGWSPYTTLPDSA
ncbi:MAG: transglycosylase domain-containing protein, partial [Rhodothermales bacterium]